MSMIALSHFNVGAVQSRSEYFVNDSQDADGIGSGGAEDYYVGAVDDLGGSAWIGKGSESLNLSGKQPSGHDFEAVFSGCDPETGERLRQGSQNGTERAGYELAFNVDKSISSLYAIADESFKADLEAAILSAHDSTLEHMAEQGFFRTRRGKGGHTKETTENIVAARFLHGTSRNQDPHLHVHCEIAAIVKNESGKWSTLDASELFKRQQETKYTFDVALAEKLQSLGLSIGENDHGVTVRGIDEALLDQWSSRRREILDELLEIGITGSGNRETNLAVTIQGRQAKSGTLNRDDLFSKWQSQAEAHGYSSGFIDEQGALGDDLRQVIKSDELEAELLNNKSVFTGRDFDRVAARYTIGRGGLSDLEQTRSQLVSELNLVRLRDDMFSTRRMVECETAVMRSAIGRKDENYHRLDADNTRTTLADRFPALRDEQHKAAMHLTAETGGLAIMEGAAGTGKSFTLSAVRELYQDNGFTVQGLAPSGKAAAELEAGSGIQSQTAHSLLLQLESGKASLSEQSVLVLDEAGMVDSVTLARLTDYAHEAGSKLILSGDSRQLEAVGTANLLRDVGREIGGADLIQITRQNGPERQEISQRFFESDGAAAIGKMEKLGMIQKERDTGSQLIAAVDQYRVNSQGIEASKNLLLADSREQVSRLNDLVRKSRVADGELDPARAVSVRLTDDADRVQDEILMPGDRVMFRQNNRDLGVTNGTTATVEAIQDTKLSVRLDDDANTLKTVDLNDYDRLDVAYAMTVHKSQGMTVDRAVYVTSDRTDSRSAYVAYTRARDGANFVTTHDADELARKIEDYREKTSVVGAFRDPESDENALLDAIRNETGQSTKVAQLDASDAIAVNRVLNEAYKTGVKDDIEGVFKGVSVALSASQKTAVAQEIKPKNPNMQNKFDREREAVLLRELNELQEQEQQDQGPTMG